MLQAAVKDELQVWFTAQEMAEAAANGVLTGIPATKQGINDLARRENWQRYHALVKSEKGRGGTITRYHIDLLPLDVRQVYLKRFIRVVPDDLRVSGAIDANLTERAREERSARMIVVRLSDRFKRLNRMTVMASDHMFVLAFNAGEVDGLPDWVAKTIGNLSVRTLQRWRAAARDNDGLTLAHDPADARKGTGLLDTANSGRVRAHILAWITDAPAVSAKYVRDYVEFKFGRELSDRNGELKPLPPPRTFQHFMANLREEEKAVIMAVSNPDQYRSRMKLVGTGAYRFVTRPNQMWMIDASPVDALCVDGRWSMYACVDVATRRYIIIFSKTPRAEAVALLIRKAILEWGVPEVIKTDNGSDFVAHATKRLFDDLDIKPDTSNAYSPAEKGIVERAIKTFQHDVAPQLPGYIGHNVADRKAIESKKSFAQRLGADDRELFEVTMTIDQLRAWTDEWLRVDYNAREHFTLKKSPNEAAAQSATKVRRIDERALDALLMPLVGANGIRKMGHQGIRNDHKFYLSGKIMVGTEVFCRQHPDDLGRIYVYSADGSEFLDVAVCPQFSGVNPAEFAAALIAENKAMVAERVKEVKAEIREIKKGPAAILRSLEVRRKRLEERQAEAANVIQLPKREEQYSTPAIAAALDAITGPRMPKARTLTEAAQKLHEAMVREAEIKAATNVVQLDPVSSLSEDARMFQWAMSIEAAIASGAHVSDEDAIRLVRYKSSTDYQVRTDLLEDFGMEVALRG